MTPEFVLPAVEQPKAIADAIDALRASGNTNAGPAIDAAQHELEGSVVENDKMIVIFSDGRARDDRVDDDSADHGASATSDPGRASPSFGSRQPIRSRGVSAAARGARHPVFDESPGELLGQCRGRELLCDAENRTDSSTAVSDTAGSHQCHLYVYRRLL